MKEVCAYLSRLMRIPLGTYAYVSFLSTESAEDTEVSFSLLSHKKLTAEFAEHAEAIIRISPRSLRTLRLIIYGESYWMTVFLFLKSCCVSFPCFQRFRGPLFQ